MNFNLPLSTCTMLNLNLHFITCLMAPSILPSQPPPSSSQRMKSSSDPALPKAWKRCLSFSMEKHHCNGSPASADYCHLASLKASSKEVSGAVFPCLRNWPPIFKDKGKATTAGHEVLGTIRLWRQSERGWDRLPVWRIPSLGLGDSCHGGWPTWSFWQAFPWRDGWLHQWGKGNVPQNQ